MTYDKYTHMMTLIVNSHKKYENDNAKENKTQKKQQKQVNKTMIVWEQWTISRGHAYHFAHKLYSIVQK